MADDCNCGTATIENYPNPYFSRFSLCVLDVVRRLQQHPLFEKGVEMNHIVEYLRHQPYLDGDLCSQVATALQDLESSGYLMYMKNGYKTMGPFAKISAAKSQKQRRIVWRKLEMKFGYKSTDVMLPLKVRRNRRMSSESDFRNPGSSPFNSQESLI